MKLALRQSRKDDDGNPIPTAELVNVLPHHADWYEMIRILYLQRRVSDLRITPAVSVTPKKGAFYYLLTQP